MKAEITAMGVMRITPETETECYAVLQWFNDPHHITGLNDEEVRKMMGDEVFEITTASDTVVQKIYGNALEVKYHDMSHSEFADKVFEVMGIEQP